MYIYKHIHIHIYTYVYAYIYTYKQKYSLYVYTYMYIYTHTVGRILHSRCVCVCIKDFLCCYSWVAAGFCCAVPKHSFFPVRFLHNRCACVCMEGFFLWKNCCFYERIAFCRYLRVALVVLLCSMFHFFGLTNKKMKIKTKKSFH